MYGRSRVLSQAETARKLGVTPRTLRRWVQSGYFPHPFRLGRTPYYSEQTVKDWIDDQINTAH
ncbi:MAG TPA: helix-turn-helix domain-containing protein [Intrasporangiaceae bacterium]|nr:helix-turn-helix domain-containing protein [Intrasporangiaceae bacterium]